MIVLIFFYFLFRLVNNFCSCFRFIIIIMIFCKLDNNIIKIKSNIHNFYALIRRKKNNNNKYLYFKQIKNGKIQINKYKWENSLNVLLYNVSL